MSERALRLNGALRSALIAYGVAGFSWLFSRQSPVSEAASFGSELKMFGFGLGAQLVLFILKQWVGRYERARGLEGQVVPLVVYLCELVLDGVTVLLFAIATFGRMAQFAHDI